VGEGDAAEGEREEGAAAKKGGGPRRAGHAINGTPAPHGLL
jgi:hypothetical protein